MFDNTYLIIVKRNDFITNVKCMLKYNKRMLVMRLLLHAIYIIKYWRLEQWQMKLFFMADGERDLKYFCAFMSAVLNHVVHGKTLSNMSD